MAVRYDQKTKEKVVEFVRNFNESHGRGGQSAAVAKWSLNPITVKSWLDKAGISTPGKKGRKKSTSRKTRPQGSTGGNPAKIDSLERMAQIQSQITILESEYNRLKSSL